MVPAGVHELRVERVQSIVVFYVLVTTGQYSFLKKRSEYGVVHSTEVFRIGGSTVRAVP